MRYQAAVAFCAIIVTLWLRKPSFQLFSKSHTALSILVLFAVWKHPTFGRTQSHIGVFIATAAYASLVALQLISVVFQNTILSRRCARAYVANSGDISRITLELGRPRAVKPGEFIYIRIPALGFSSLFESHPFMVAWQDVDEEGKAVSLILLVQPRGGFTRKIKCQANDSEPYLTWIDGPYGKPPNYGEYENVILVASGIGIAEYVLVIKDLVEGFRDRKVSTKSIALYWQLDHDCKAHPTHLTVTFNLRNSSKPRLGSRLDDGPVGQR